MIDIEGMIEDITENIIRDCGHLKQQHMIDYAISSKDVKERTIKRLNRLRQTIEDNEV